MTEERFKVLVVGDIMLDMYTYLSTSRRAPEADIPVWDVIDSEIRLGGAANTANNLKRLGGDSIDVYLAGIVGLGLGGISLIKDSGINTDCCMGGSTMIKHRMVSADRKEHLFRVDNIQKFPEKDVSFFNMMSRTVFPDETFHAIVISDYDKGTITEDIAAALCRHPLVVVDSKRYDLRPFTGAKVIKLNEAEYSMQVSNDLYPYFERYFEYCVVTKGQKGSELRMCEHAKSDDRRYVIHSEDFPVDPVYPVDVTGCGDTHTAAMVFSMLRDGDVRAAVRYANNCARGVVQKFGTSVCDKE